MPPEENQRVESLRSGVRGFSPKTRIYLEGDVCHEVSVLCAGWVIIWKVLFDGSRQILDFALPGDLIGFPFSEAVDRMDHAAEAITEVKLCVFPTATILKEIRTNASLASGIIWATGGQRARAYEHMTDLGRRSAQDRMAHLLLELFTRLRKNGATSGMTSEFPLTQSHLADALGLSTVHVNRVLRQFRERGIATVANHELTILDLEAVEEMCDYDDTYLRADERNAEPPI